MSVVVEVELLAGRYHAHVWGDSQFAMSGPEWPPSPWRFLRATASAWFETRPSPSTTAARDALFERLGRSPAPEMWLPATAFREARYYQPLEHKRALHHDLFAVPVGGRFYFAFDVTLSDEQRRLLDVLMGRLQYFGRAESRAKLRLRDDLTAPPAGLFRIVPRDRVEPGDWSPCRVLCPSSGRDFRSSDLWTSREVASARKPKQAKTGTEEPGAPVHLVDALLSDRKPLPDGALWVEYALPRQSVIHEAPRKHTKAVVTSGALEVSTLVFRLCRRVPITVGDTVAVARAFRDAAVRSFAVATGGAHSRTLTGREADGTVEQEHRHLYYLPQPDTGTLEISSMVIRVPTGTLLSREELDALASVQQVRIDRGDRYPITVVPEGIDGTCLVASRRWKSLTPFLPSLRHRLGRTATTTEAQLASFANASFGITPIVTAVPGPGGAGVRTPVRVHQYALAAKGKPAAPSWRFTRRLGHWFMLEFETPISIETSLGADAHFGLGQFFATEDS